MSHLVSIAPGVCHPAGDTLVSLGSAKVASLMSSPVIEGCVRKLVAVYWEFQLTGFTSRKVNLPKRLRRSWWQITLFQSEHPRKPQTTQRCQDLETEERVQVLRCHRLVQTRRDWGTLADP